jgi:hypothetical protein
MKTQIQHFLALLRGAPVNNVQGLSPDDTSYHIITEIFSTGNCGNLAIIMANMFNGELCCTQDHAFTEIIINGIPTYWDITGEIFPPSFTYVTSEQLDQLGFIDNYSFEERGPLC